MLSHNGGSDKEVGCTLLVEKQKKATAYSEVLGSEKRKQLARSDTILIAAIFSTLTKEIIPRNPKLA